GLARVASEERITFVTGGTDAGVFALLGEGFDAWPRTAPCIGVAPRKCIALSPEESAITDRAALESHHTHFVFTGGIEWGDETKLMCALLNKLGARCPSIAVFAGGGDVTLGE